RPVVRAAKARLVTQTNQRILRKSLGFKVRTYGDKVVGIIGPRTGFRTIVGYRTYGKDGTRLGVRERVKKPIYEDPAKIAHLVEFGHGGPHPAPAHPFLRPAFDGTKKEAQDTVTDETWKEIEKEAK